MKLYCPYFQTDQAQASHLSSIAQEAVRQGIVQSISPCSVQRFLKFAGVAPWKNRYWLNSPEKHENKEGSDGKETYGKGLNSYVWSSIRRYYRFYL